MTATAPTTINGIPAQDVLELIQQIEQQPAKGMTRWHVITRWAGGMRSTTTVAGFDMAGNHVPRQHRIDIDEPLELGGTNTHANPQEYLMAAVNACMSATFVALCSLQNIELESLSIETEGHIDLRGFLGIDASVPPGYEQMRFHLKVKGSASAQQFEVIHQQMQKLSPNFFNMATAIPLRCSLSVA